MMHPTPNPRSLEELAEAAKNDLHAMTELVSRTEPLRRKLATKYTHAFPLNAEWWVDEIAQVTAVKMWSAIQRYDRARGKVTTWLGVLAKGAASDLRKRELRERGFDPAASTPMREPLSTIEPSVESKKESSVPAFQESVIVLDELRLRLERELKPRDVAALFGKALGFETKELSPMLDDWSPSGIDTATSRARGKVRALRVDYLVGAA